jgi:hypothetical protein
VVDHTRAIKKFQRSAAGKDEALPHDVRTPLALQKTMDFIISVILNDPVWHGPFRADMKQLMWRQTLFLLYDRDAL